MRLGNSLGLSSGGSTKSVVRTPSVFTYSDASTSTSDDWALSSSSYDSTKDLTGISFGTCVTDILTDAFQNRGSLTSISFQSGARIKSIGQTAFIGCTEMTSFPLPNSLEVIKDNAFAYCSKLATANAQAASQLKTIGIGAFQRTGLTTFNIRGNVTKVDHYAFYNCTSLASIGGNPASLTTIGDWALSGCTSLTTINIPSAVTRVGYRAFTDSRNLATIYFLGEKPILSYPPDGSSDIADLASGTSANVSYCTVRTSWSGTTTFGGRPASSRVC